MSNPVFICGFPKTGTTLITQLFNNLPHTYIDIELHFAPFILRMIRDALISGEISTTVEKPDPLATRMLELSKDDFKGYLNYGKDMFENLHTGFHYDWRWGNNCKATIDFIPTLKMLYPNAVIINMLRDPRDVWASIRQAKWKGLEYFSDMTYFLSRYRNVYEMAKLPGITTLMYNDLVTNPQSAFDLIGEEFKPEYIKGTGKTFRYRTLPIQKKDFEDGILTSRIGRYKTEVPDYETNMIEDHMRDIIENHFQ